jgi:hypothetical protein
MLRRRIKHVLSPLYPSSGIGSGWLLKVCADAPWLFHALPEKWRLYIAHNTLGPKGHDFMKDRVVGKVSLMTGRKLALAKINDRKLDLHVVGENGSREILPVDHVIAATGYRIDINKLAFIDDGLRSAVRTVEGGPVLSVDYESSVPGLYFIGPASLNSFGPVTRFVLGSLHSSRQLTRHLSQVHDAPPFRAPPIDAAVAGATIAPTTKSRAWQT